MAADWRREAEEAKAALVDMERDRNTIQVAWVKECDLADALAEERKQSCPVPYDSPALASYSPALARHRERRQT